MSGLYGYLGRLDYKDKILPVGQCGTFCVCAATKPIAAAMFALLQFSICEQLENLSIVDRNVIYLRIKSRAHSVGVKKTYNGGKC